MSEFIPTLMIDAELGDSKSSCQAFRLRRRHMSDIYELPAGKGTQVGKSNTQHNYFAGGAGGFRPEFPVQIGLPPAAADAFQHRMSKNLTSRWPQVPCVSI